MKPRPIIMDVDTGIDDALALFLVAGSKELDLKGITVVAGNQTLDKTLSNTLKMVEMLRLDIPVAKGATKPILGKGITAADVHGDSGLGLFDEKPAKISASDLSSVELISNICENSDEKITLVPTGPLTNIATFLLSYPHLKTKIDCICLMGGGALLGNRTVSAEFNFYCDPEAAQIVFQSEIPIIMCGLDVTHEAYITKEEIERLVSYKSPVATAAKQMLSFYYDSYMRRTNLGGAALHDSVPVAYLIRPELFGGLNAYVEIDLEGKLTRGSSICDGMNLLERDSNAFVVTSVNREKFIDLTIERFQNLVSGGI